MSPTEIVGILEIIYVILLGLVFGSFATMLAHRGHIFTRNADKEQNGEGMRSCCPHCKTKMKVIDLVPVFSWLLQRGKCRYCAKSISRTYPAIELSVLLMGLMYFYMHGFTPVSQTMAAYAAFSILIALAVFDFRHKILPNNLVATLGVVGLFYRFWPSHFDVVFSAQIFEYGGGALVYALVVFLIGLFMHKILGRQALGMGDVKFFAVAGLWLGLSKFALFCIFSGVFGVFLGLFWKKFKKEDRFPFGPALILSFFVLLLLGSSHLL